ncbi:MAG TPA: hypothetical protein VE569_01850 [Acidimicrobiia bacterium]|nr:hypothetical protein [Acidimicrobiia bacterium]
MAQQPNVEITAAESPRTKLEPGPAVKWRADKPGMPHGPNEVGGGGYYGTTGPDPGWGLRLVSQRKLPDDDEHLRQVVIGLMMARAAALGRAPVSEDIQAALALCGYGFEATVDVIERRKHWLKETAHDPRPGATAVAEVDKKMLVMTTAEIGQALRWRESSPRSDATTSDQI